MVWGLEMIQSSERVAREDCLHRQEIMMPMLNQNQQMMMAILALLSRDNTGDIGQESTKPIDEDNNDENKTK